MPRKSSSTMRRIASATSSPGRRLWRVSLRLGLLIGLAITPGCGSEKVVEAPTLRPVRTQQVFATGGRRVRSFSGSFRAGMEANLSFKVPGTIRRLDAELGHRVAAGSVIATLDPMDYELQVQQAQHSLARARAESRNASANYERVRLLYENNNSSLNELEAAQTIDESAREGVGAAEKQLELVRLQLSYATLKAPTAGSIASIDVEINENVAAGRRVVVLTSGDRPEVVVSMPELLIGQVLEGAKVEVKSGALRDRVLPATVTEVGIAASRTDTTFPVTVRLDAPEADVRPGMAAEVDFVFESPTKREVFIVAPVAVGEDAEARFVFVVKATSDGRGVVERRNVKIGALTSDGLEILSGLSDGELVVTAGVSRMSSGLTVKLLPQKS